MAAKRSASKSKEVKRSTPVKRTSGESSSSISSTYSTPQTKSSLKFSRNHIFVLAGVIILAALLYYYRSVFVAATVNGQPISRIALVSELEKQGGKQAMNSLITKTLIEQEARKKNVSVNSSEIDAEIKKIEANLSKQGQKLDQVLQVQGMTMSTLKDQIRLQKLVEKMVGKDITVSDKEVNDYIEANKASLPQDSKPDALKTDVRDRLKQTKLNDKVQTWLADLQKNASINYFVKF